MANGKRPAFSFPELEPRGRGAILRSAEEVRAEEARLAATDAAGGVPQPADATESDPPHPARGRGSPSPTNKPARTPSIRPSSSPSISRPAGRPIDRLGDRIVDRPKAFYITERIDRYLDEAVRYFQLQHGLRKVDRSTLVNALLGDDALWTEQALDALTDRVVGQLTSRLTR